MSAVLKALFSAHLRTAGGEDWRQGASEKAAATAQMGLGFRQVAVGIKRGDKWEDLREKYSTDDMSDYICGWAAGSH